MITQTSTYYFPNSEFEGASFLDSSDLMVSFVTDIAVTPRIRNKKDRQGNLCTRNLCSYVNN